MFCREGFVGFSDTGAECYSAQQLLRREAFSKFAHIEGFVAFAKPLSGGIAEQREMGETRRTKAEKVVQIELLGHRLQEVASADHFCDAHKCVVHHDSQLVCPSAITSLQNEVSALLFEVEGLRPVMDVGEGTVSKLAIFDSFTFFFFCV